MSDTQPLEQLLLSWTDSQRMLNRLQIDGGHHLLAEAKRGCWVLQDVEGQKVWEFRPPLTFPAIVARENLKEYLPRIPEQPGNYFLLLIQAGQAGLAFCCEGEIVDQKIFRAYMVRKKQGKSQLKHLKTKGKSRAGSRSRLAQTEKFLKEIAAWTSERYRKENVSDIFYSCQPLLWGMLFQEKHRFPFEKNNPLIRKIPLDIDLPDTEEIERANKAAQLGRLSLYHENAIFTIR